MINLFSEQEMTQFGEIIGRNLFEGAVIILEGDLGAGKTTLAKGIARGLGVKETVKSPTYTIIREYQSGSLPLYHMDVYRTEGHVSDLELDDYFYGDGVSLVEWGQLLEKYLPEDFLTLKIEKNDKGRTITLNTDSPSYEALINSIIKGYENERIND